MVENSQQEQLISIKKATDPEEEALKEVPKKEIPKKITMTAERTAIPDQGITPNSSAMTPISSEDDIIISPKKRTPLQCPVTFSSNTAKTQTPDSSPTKPSPEKNTVATQSPPKPVGRNRRQAKFFGSPIRHADKEISNSTALTKGEICGAVPVSAEELSESS